MEKAMLRSRFKVGDRVKLTEEAFKFYAGMDMFSPQDSFEVLYIVYLLNDWTLSDEERAYDNDYVLLSNGEILEATELEKIEGE